MDFLLAKHCIISVMWRSYMKCAEAVQCHSKLSTDNACSETLGCPCISPYTTTVASNENIFISCIHPYTYSTGDSIYDMAQWESAHSRVWQCGVGKFVYESKFLLFWMDKGFFCTSNRTDVNSKDYGSSSSQYYTKL